MLKIEMRPTDRVVPYDRNPRINDGRTAVERAFGRLSAFAATPPAPPAATGTTD